MASRLRRNLSIPLYGRRTANGNSSRADKHSARQLWEEWEQDGRLFWQEMDALVDMLDGLTSGETEKD